MTPALETVALVKRFGGVAATQGVSLRLDAGARHALIGPNGAGKTTLVDQLAGALRPDAGRILLGGVDVTRLGPARRARMGLGRTFQISQMFPRLTVAESIAVAVAERLRRGGDAWGGRAARAAIAAETAAIVDRLGLGDVAERPSATLPYGRQRQLDIAVALAGSPRVLLLDEPAAGVPEADRRALLATLDALPAEVAILLIDHDMDLVFSFARRISVLVAGQILAEGPPARIAADPRVRAVYLGDADG